MLVVDLIESFQQIQRYPCMYCYYDWIEYVWRSWWGNEWVNVGKCIIKDFLEETKKPTWSRSDFTLQVRNRVCNDNVFFFISWKSRKTIEFYWRPYKKGCPLNSFVVFQGFDCSLDRIWRRIKRWDRFVWLIWVQFI